MIRYVLERDILLRRTWPPVAHEREGPKSLIWEGRAGFAGEGEKKQYISRRNISRLLYNLHANPGEFIEGALVAFFVDVSQT